MLSKNGNLVNFTDLHRNYLVAERHKVNGVYEYSVHSWASTVLHICAWVPTSHYFTWCVGYALLRTVLLVLLGAATLFLSCLCYDLL